MVPMILSSFCPNDCDRPDPPPPKATGERLVLLAHFPADSLSFDNPDYRRWTTIAGQFRTLVLGKAPNFHGQHILLPEVGGRVVDIPDTLETTFGGRLIRVVEVGHMSYDVVEVHRC